MSPLLCFAAVIAMAARSHGLASTLAEDELCPVLYHGECFKILHRFRGAFSRTSGDELCHDVETLGIGYDGHLANVYDEEHFTKLAAYLLRSKADPDPDVLLGMIYDPEAGTLYTYEGDIIEKPYWGKSARPLSWGINMVLRASKVRASSTKLQNMGDDKIRYSRILCQYKRK